VPNEKFMIKKEMGADLFLIAELGVS